MEDSDDELLASLESILGISKDEILDMGIRELHDRLYDKGLSLNVDLHVGLVENKNET